MKIKKKNISPRQEALTSNSLLGIINQKLAIPGLQFKEDGRGLSGLVMFCIACFLLTFVSQTVALINSRDDMNRSFESFSNTFSCGMAGMKLLSLRMKKKQWKKILNNIAEMERFQTNYVGNEDEYESDEENGSPTFRSYIESYTTKFQYVSKILMKIYGISVSIYMISPFVEYVFYKCIGKEDVTNPHILPGWESVDSISIFVYLANIAIEIISITYYICIHIAFDVVVIGTVVFVCGQFAMLRAYSENIGGKGDICLLSKKRDKRAHGRITLCYKIHVQLTSICDEMGELIQNILGIYFFASIARFCSIAVRLNSELTIAEALTLIEYIFAILSQLFFFCYFGDNVLHQSAVDAGQGPFGAAYWCLSPSIRKELVLLGIGMMVPRYIKAGPLIYVNLPSFVMIVKTTYSYYAVIRN